MPLPFAAADAGILPDRMIAALADAGAILPAYEFTPDQVQPASLDLRLGDIAYRVRASFLPGPNTTVGERIDDLKLHEINLADGAVLETGCVYIVPLIESLALPPAIAASANPKSSTGRLDVFTRVIVDRARGFYRMFASFSETDLPKGAGDFRLLDRKAVNALKALGERARFSKGLYSWIGFKSIGVTFDSYGHLFPSKDDKARRRRSGSKAGLPG